MRKCLIVKLNLLIFLFNICFFSFFQKTYSEVINKKDSFYVWQKDWKSINLNDAVKNVKDFNLYYNSREFTNEKIQCTYPSQSLFCGKGKRIPVFRIYLSRFKKNFNNEKIFAQIILNEFNKEQKLYNSTELEELQLDIDCPESKLKNYLELIKCIREKLKPNIKLSCTILPCHLKYSILNDFAKFADYLILQVHGPDVIKNINNEMQLFNKKATIKALNSIKKLDFKYKIALPSYAYEALFDAKNKQFIRFSAEVPYKENKEILSRIVSFKIKDLVDCVNILKNEKSINFRGVIWFRLPVKGDRLNLDMETLQTIRNGKYPKIGILPYWEIDKKKCFNLYLKNQGLVSLKKVLVEMQWETTGSYDILNGYKNISNNKHTLIMPSSLTGIIPKPGEKILIAWFRTLNNQPPKIKVSLK